MDPPSLAGGALAESVLETAPDLAAAIAEFPVDNGDLQGL
jgi:hypothetical protein